jgi:FtsH-binding integral membrane protein
MRDSSILICPQARYGCSEPGCGCILSLIAGTVVWSVVSSTSAQLLKLILRPEQVQALPPWLASFQNNVSIFAGTLAALICFALIGYRTRKDVTFSRQLDHED